MYSPSEDSFLLSACLKKYLKNKKSKNKKAGKELKILDMGSGTGIQAETCIKAGFSDVLCADIDKNAVDYLRKKKFKAVKSDLFSKIPKKEKFDLIIFNPPYLPEDKYDKEKDTAGGKKGYETIIRFLGQAKSHLSAKGEILLLFSSLSSPKTIINRAENLGYKSGQLSSKKLFFEELFVYMLKI